MAISSGTVMEACNALMVDHEACRRSIDRNDHVTVLEERTKRRVE